MTVMFAIFWFFCGALVMFLVLFIAALINQIHEWKKQQLKDATQELKAIKTVIDGKGKRTWMDRAETRYHG